MAVDFDKPLWNLVFYGLSFADQLNLDAIVAAHDYKVWVQFNDRLDPLSQNFTLQGESAVNTYGGLYNLRPPVICNC